MAFVPKFSCQPATERRALSILALCRVFLVCPDFDLTGKWLKWLLLRSAKIKLSSWRLRVTSREQSSMTQNTFSHKNCVERIDKGTCQSNVNIYVLNTTYRIDTN